MTEYELRTAYVGKASTYIGMKGMTDKMQVMCDLYNSNLQKEHDLWGTRLTKYVMANQMKSGWGWCGVFVSCIGEELGFDSFIPVEMGLYEYVKIAKENGLWKDNTYSPKGGDIIMYKWHDTEGNATSSNPYDHIEIVEYVSNGKVGTIGGNNGAKPGICSRRTTQLDSIDIAGYVTPNYTSATDPTEPEEPEEEKTELEKLFDSLNAGDSVKLVERTDEGMKLKIDRITIQIV